MNNSERERGKEREAEQHISRWVGMGKVVQGQKATYVHFLALKAPENVTSGYVFAFNDKALFLA